METGEKLRMEWNREEVIDYIPESESRNRVIRAAIAATLFGILVGFISAVLVTFG